MNEEVLVREIKELRELLSLKESQLTSLRRSKQVTQDHGLNNEEIARYSRQIFLPEFGIGGQKKIKNASVLIVGAGGLGCPAALYLTSAGIGHIGIVDYDDIEINNLHRQILFNEATIGMPKAIIAAENLRRLNSYVKVTPYKIQLNSKTATEVIKDYDIVLDATDNVATRYLLNDACVLLGKPLVSASALRCEGHLTVYNHNGPCYRCIFPTPPPHETVTNCGDGGVLGAVVGTIGVLQALEALKIVLNKPDTLSQRFLLFDGMETKFRTVKLRGKNPKCEVCGEKPTVKELIDYEQFCGAKANDKNPNLSVLDKEERITVEEYNDKIKSQPHLLIDVRSPEEYEIWRLNKSINIPIDKISNSDNVQLIKQEFEKIKKENNESEEEGSVYVLCRRGNDSQKAVRALQGHFKDDRMCIKDIIGGIHAWSKKIDPTVPIY